MNKSVAKEAHEIIHGERRSAYGPVEESFQRIADLANIMLPGKVFTPQDVAIFLLCLKLARERAKHGRDNLVDLCGYADLLQQLYDHDAAKAA